MTILAQIPCPKCGNQNVTAAIHCGRCGATLPTDELETNKNLDEMLQAAIPPRSWAAWIGFVLAVLLLVPWLAVTFRRFMGDSGLVVGGIVGVSAGVFAAILGIIGIFRTRKRRRRGRLVAIAAIPLGLVGGVFQLLVGMMGYGILAVKTHGDLAVEILRSPSSELVDRAKEWHADVASARFQVAVTEEELTGWLKDVIAKHGQLQSAKMIKKKPFDSERGVTVYRVTGQFVNDSTPIELVIGFDSSSQAKVDDIRVGDSTPRDWKPESE